MTALPLLLSLLQAPATDAAPASRPASRPAVAAPTFAEHIAPILFANCTGCHRPGEAAPFALTSYDEARRKARMIQRVTERRLMPPWHAEPGHVPFADERRLTDEQIATIARWVETGAPEGDAKKTPPLPTFPEGWQLGQPDLVLTMDEAFAVPASGPDLYRNFVLPVHLEADQWVTAVELRPSARKVVHHSLFFLDDSGQAKALDGKDGKPGFRGMGFRRSGSLGGWAVGGTPRHLPQGLALPLPKGSDLVLQTHFHPSGKAEEEKTTVGLYFAKAPPKRSLVPIQVPPLFGALWGIDIPAGEKRYFVQDQVTLPAAVDAVMVGGHAHYLCATMKCTARTPDGKEIVLLSIPRWDFNWQDHYVYQEPVRLPAGTRLTMELTYDNSADNPANPHSPPVRVRWGRESNDEMGAITVTAIPVDERDVALLRRSFVSPFARGGRDGGRALGNQIGNGIADQVDGWDKNGDGVIKADEVPERLRRFFDRFDSDGDGVLDKSEIESLKKQLRGLGR